MESSSFDYSLPSEAIAQAPLSPRDSSRLLVDGETILHKHVRDLPAFLREGDLVVLNNTRVMHARLNLFKKTGGAVEVLVLSELPDGRWKALIRPSRKVPSGSLLYNSSQEAVLKVIGNGALGVRTIEAKKNSIRHLMENYGKVPLPPYITTDLKDAERYQTIFSEEEKSVAAPTAGLHLTQSVLDGVKAAGADVAFVELSVGLGTFRPIEASDLSAHSMHEEEYKISPKVWDACLDSKRVVAIGTTVVRALETVAITHELEGKSNLFITPGFEFKVVDSLLTNFHQPRSTLLVMIEAFIGTRWRELYSLALDNGYRFLSFGDAMFLERQVI
ncbi:MAG: tRNA preQ1(34) S-adenosylmethionine ribosyltransferase-isomerase QueA [Actinobacteria bacterium]|nr:tRNA preQ1(34) S-adenosylmethionine ribosyltransferase-isomerase QueA [Actinomycetota bacterium]|tara:strand:+ start:3704 stop:4699 length:996 start_codon:yes stop_codon:yes gene_type:complete